MELVGGRGEGRVVQILSLDNLGSLEGWESWALVLEGVDARDVARLTCLLAHWQDGLGRDVDGQLQVTMRVDGPVAVGRRNDDEVVELVGFELLAAVRGDRVDVHVHVAELPPRSPLTSLIIVDLDSDIGPFDCRVVR